jgi:hypothetical protein
MGEKALWQHVHISTRHTMQKGSLFQRSLDACDGDRTGVGQSCLVICQHILGLCTPLRMLNCCGLHDAVLIMDEVGWCLFVYISLFHVPPWLHLSVDACTLVLLW